MAVTATGLWTDTHAAVQARFGDYLLVTAAFSFLPNVIATRFADNHPGATLAVGLIGLISQIAIVAMTVSSTCNTGDALRRVMPLFLPAFGLSFLMGLGILPGLILLIVPGLYVMARWSAALPALVDGTPGVINAMRQSWAITRDGVWPIVAMLAVLFIMLIIGAMIATFVGALFSGDPEQMTLPGALLLGGVASVFSIYYSVLQGVIYNRTKSAA